MRDSKPIVLIRLAVGAVFLSEGIQKFLFPDALGVGRFIKIGIPAPSIMAPFVGVVEILGGAMLIIGLFTCYSPSNRYCRGDHYDKSPYAYSRWVLESRA